MCDATWHHWLSFNLTGIVAGGVTAYRKMQRLIAMSGHECQLTGLLRARRLERSVQVFRPGPITRSRLTPMSRVATILRLAKNALQHNEPGGM